MNESTGEGLQLEPRRVAKNAASQLVGTFAGTLSGAVAGILIARALGPAGFGVFSVGWAVAGAAAYLAPLGLQTLLVREINRARSLTDLRGALLPTAVTGVAIAGALAVVPRAIGVSPDISAVLAASAPFIVATGPLAVIRAVFAGRERMELVAVVDALGGILALVAVAIALAAQATPTVTILALGAAQILNLLVATALHRRYTAAPRDHTRPATATLGRRLRAALPMAVATVLQDIHERAEILVLGPLVVASEVGLYSAAVAIVLYAPVIGRALDAALYPVLSRATGGVHDPLIVPVFRSAWRIQIVLGLAAAAGLVVVAEPVIRLLYGAQYSGAAPLLAVLAVLIPLRILSRLCGTTLNALDRQHHRAWAVGTALTVNLVLAVVLVPAFGLAGAVTAKLVSEAFLLLFVLVSLRPVRPAWLRPLVEATTVAAVAALLAWAVPGHVLARVAVAAVGGVTVALVLLRDEPLLRGSVLAPMLRRREETA